MTKNYKPTIFCFVYINMIKIAIFHVYGRHFVLQNGRPYANFKKKFLIIILDHITNIWAINI